MVRLKVFIRKVRLQSITNEIMIVAITAKHGSQFHVCGCKTWKLFTERIESHKAIGLG